MITLDKSTLLHNTKDDDVTLLDIYEEFGSDIASLVRWLTDTSIPKDNTP